MTRNNHSGLNYQQTPSKGANSIPIRNNKGSESFINLTLAEVQ
jgi:hypothetical protein